MGESRVRRLGAHEVREAAATLALSFDEDPLFVYWLPQRERRQAWLRWFHAISVGEAMATGGAWTLDDGPRFGVMATIPPGRFPPAARETMRAVPWPTHLPTTRLLVSGLGLWRKIGTLHPREDHVYLAAIGVHPAHKGRGLGGALLRHLVTLADD